jgi:hypothetical protein
MNARHARPVEQMQAEVASRVETFDAQFAYSLRMAEIHRNRPIQDKVNEYIEARRQDKKEWEKEGV